MLETGIKVSERQNMNVEHLDLKSLTSSEILVERYTYQRGKICLKCKCLRS